MKRKAPSLKVKLASALLQQLRYNEAEAEFVPVISYAEAKTLSADQIIARFHFDHGIAHAHGGPAEPWNLKPLPVAEHREKTARIDVPRIAKCKRIAKNNARHAGRLAAKDRGERKPASRWPKRKMQSRNSFATRAVSTESTP